MDIQTYINNKIHVVCPKESGASILADYSTQIVCRNHAQAPQPSPPLYSAQVNCYSNSHLICPHTFFVSTGVYLKYPSAPTVRFPGKVVLGLQAHALLTVC